MKTVSFKIILFTLIIALTAFIGRAQSWTNLCQLSSPNYEGSAISAIAVDVSGNIYETGLSHDGNDYSYATMAYTSTGVPLWTNFYGGPEFGILEATAIAASSNGNTYVTGFSPGNGTGQDYATLAYSSAGVPLWTNRYTSSGNDDDFATAIAVAGNGNVYVTGSSAGNSYATIAYSSAGKPLWTNFLASQSGTGSCSANAVAVDGGGNVYVTGCCWLASVANYSYATIKYSSAGTPLWTNLYLGIYNYASAASAIALAADGSGNVYVTGGIYSGSTNFATLAYSSTGTALWTNLYFTSAIKNPTIAAASSGNVYVTGNSSGPNYSYVTIAYSSTGIPLWTNYLYNGYQYSSTTGIAVDNYGNIYVTGYWTTAAYRSQFVTVAYTSAGVGLWTNLYNGVANGANGASAIAVDNNNNIYVAGHAGTAFFDGNSFAFATIKYAAPPLSIVTTNRNFGFTNGQFGFNVSGLAGSTAIIQSSPDLQTWTPVQTNILVNGQSYFSDPQSSPSGTRFYRAKPSP